ncbi:MAG: hypothetical protein IJA85_07625 [Clostridia bacterium]|nr:hypothetical protein [Clostridia bacterium]
MKKKLLCLLMCIIMVMSVVLTGCAELETEDEESAETGTNKAMTVTFYSITDGKTTPEAIAEVESAINKIIQGKFNINVELCLYTEDEYEDVIFEKIALKEEEIKKQEEEEAAAKAAAKAARESEKAARAAGITTAKTKKTETEPEETTSDEDETYINEQGREMTVYPEAEESQLDIFLVTSLDMLLDLKEAEAVTALDSELSVGAKKLKSYIYPSFLDYSKVDGSTYIIPNNHVIGDYEYVLLNKELIDKYSYDPDSSMNTLDGIMDFLEDIIRYEPDVTPLLNKPTNLVRYWNIYANEAGTRAYLDNTSEFSLIASYIPGAPGANMYSPKVFSTISQYQKYEAALDTLAAAGYTLPDVADLSTDKPFAAAFVKGDVTLPDNYEEDYYVNVYRYPLVNNDEVFGAGYAIGAYTKDVTRTMEILTYLNTNKELANLLTYGVKNIHYTVNEDTGIIEKIPNSGYYMDSIHTGNQFMLTPSSDMSAELMTLAADNWAAAKLQNQDSSVDPQLGLYFTFEEDKVDEETGKVTPAASTPVTEISAQLRELGKTYLEQVDNFVPYVDEEKGKDMDLIAWLKTLKKTIEAEPGVSEALDKENEYSIISQYTAWFEATYPDAGGM